MGGKGTEKLTEHSDLYAIIEKARKAQNPNGYVGEKTVLADIQRLLWLADQLYFDENVISALPNEVEKRLRDADKACESAERDVMMAMTEISVSLKDMQDRIQAIDDETEAVLRARKQVEDPVGRKVLAMQKALLDNYIDAGASPDLAAECTSYTLWAMLTGESPLEHENGPMAKATQEAI